MLGSLLRRIVIWPIPPRYSGHAVTIAALTVVLVALMQTQTVSGAIAAGATATALVFGGQALWRSRVSADRRGAN